MNKDTVYFVVFNPPKQINGMNALMAFPALIRGALRGNAQVLYWRIFMSKTRKVLMMNEAGRIWTEEQETPAPKPGQLLIEVHASMVSPGSELGGVKRRPRESGF